MCFIYVNSVSMTLPEGVVRFLLTNLTGTNKAVNKHDVYSDPAFCHGVTSPNVRAGLLSCVCTLTKMRVASRGYWCFRNDLEDMEKQDRSAFICFFEDV